ncbi:MAG: class I SAM-dependent methyltransferase [Elusimicrobia bacterium]|nr:class I SAM-dependent methyltransferase [Elusimicrobiota bacterium]
MVMLCPACEGSTPFALVEKVGRYEVYLCPECEVEFSHPMQGAGRQYYETSALYNGLREGAFLQAAGNHETFLRKGLLGGTLLDIGCASGAFLQAAEQAGYRVSGIDFDCSSIEQARRRGLNDVHALSLEAFAQSRPSARYDVVTFFEVLEHVERPRLLLETVKQVLRPGGVIALSAPNRDRFFYKTRLDLEMDCPPVHLTRWTSGALRRFLESQGFEIEELSVSPLRSSDVAFILQSKIVFGVAKRIQDTGKSQDSSVMVHSASIMMRLKETAMKGAAAALMPWIFLRGGQGNGLFCLARLGNRHV